ncbi:MAG TPA: PTS sugar transporter subunit IIA [Anaerolineales bacterium]|nr:PTS sugar transporter subunit IIA [Anaerolineales bacterium]
MELTAHSRRILEVLLSTQEEMACAGIASRLGLTARQVQYRTPQIRGWLAARNVRLTVRAGCGLKLETTARIRQLLRLELKRTDVGKRSLTRAERAQIFSLLMLAAPGPLLAKQLAHEAGISRNTVLRDLVTVESWLTAKHLTLQRRPNVGCSVDGREGHIRGAIADAVLECAGEEALLSALDKRLGRQALQERIRHPARELVQPILQSLHLPQVNVVIGEALPVELTDRAHLMLALQVGVTLLRMRQGRHLKTVRPHAENLKAWRELDVAQRVASLLEGQARVKFNEAEYAYLVRCLQQAEARHPITHSVAKMNEVGRVPARVIGCVDYLLERVSLYLHPSLRDDDELRGNLALHLAEVLGRDGPRPAVINPLLPEIKRTLGHVFRSVEEAVWAHPELREVVDEAEAGYITMHVASALERLRHSAGLQHRVLLVCNAGAATALLLEARLRSEFADIRIIGSLSYLELTAQGCPEEVDLIISTIPLRRQRVPVIVVSPLLQGEDVGRVRAALLGEAASVPAVPSPGLNGGGVNLSSLITADVIELKASAETWQEVVDRAGRPLLRGGLVTLAYLRAVKDVVSTHGPYMVIWPGIALLHAPPGGGVRRLCMSLVTFERPVSFGHPENDPVDVAIMLGAIDSRSHVPALFQLIALLKDHSAVSELRSAVEKARVLSWIAHYSA